MVVGSFLVVVALGFALHTTEFFAVDYSLKAMAPFWVMVFLGVLIFLWGLICDVVSRAKPEETMGLAQCLHHVICTLPIADRDEIIDFLIAVERKSGNFQFNRKDYDLAQARSEESDFSLKKHFAEPKYQLVDIEAKAAIAVSTFDVIYFITFGLKRSTTEIEWSAVKEVVNVLQITSDAFLSSIDEYIAANDYDEEDAKLLNTVRSEADKYLV